MSAKRAAKSVPTEAAVDIAEIDAGSTTNPQPSEPSNASQPESSALQDSDIALWHEFACLERTAEEVDRVGDFFTPDNLDRLDAEECQAEWAAIQAELNARETEFFAPAPFQSPRQLEVLCRTGLVPLLDKALALTQFIEEFPSALIDRYGIEPYNPASLLHAIWNAMLAMGGKQLPVLPAAPTTVHEAIRSVHEVIAWCEGCGQVSVKPVDSPKTEPAADDPPKGARLRNELWASWNLKHGDARDKWNAMSDLERMPFAPFYRKIPAGKSGWDTVRKGIKSLQKKSSNGDSR
jgi:hypothetical protein